MSPGSSFLILYLFFGFEMDLCNLNLNSSSFLSLLRFLKVSLFRLRYVSIFLF